MFDNDTGRLAHSLPGSTILPGKLAPCSNVHAGLIKPVRAVAFSPGGKLLAAAGDSRIISLYDVSSGEHITSLAGHKAWVFALDWNDTGEYLLSG